MESNSKLRLSNSGISQTSIENEDDSFIIPATFNLNELKNTNDGNESEKGFLKYETEVNSEVLIRRDCMSDLPYNNIASSENEVILCKTNGSTEISNDAGIKKSLKQIEHKSYVESDIENNAYSSSDEEVVLQTRICNEEGKPISNIPEDNSNHIGKHAEPNNNEPDNFNKFCNDDFDCGNLENEQFEKFDSPSRKERNTNIPVKASNKNINFNALDQKGTACLGESFTKKIKPPKKFPAETLSFELSSLSEAGDNELLTDICTNSSNEKKMYKKDTDLHAEVIQRCLDISSEVHSMCDDIEKSETSTLNVIVHDFFNGTLDVNKYEINKKSPNKAAVSQVTYETEQNGMNNEDEILNIQKTCLTIPATQESLIINTNSDDEQVHTNKPANNKALRMKHISKKDASTIKKKLPTVRSTKNYLNDKQKNRVHVPNNYQSLDKTHKTELLNEDPLSRGKFSYLKPDDNNKTAIKCTAEAVNGKSFHKTMNKMKWGNCTRPKTLESHIMGDDKLEDVSCSNLFKNNLFQLNEVELQEKIEKDNKKYTNQYTSKEERKARYLSLSNKSHLFTDESEIVQQTRLTSEHLKNNSPFKNIRVGQPSKEVSTDIKKNMATNKELIKTKDSKLRYIVENANLNKRPKTWDDLENLFSEEIANDSYDLQDCYEKPTTSKKAESIANSVNVYGIINKQTKKARIQTDVANDFSVVSHSLQNKKNTILKDNPEISPKTVSKRNNELALISPNANIINKIMKNMEKCTLPYLTSSQARQKIFLNDPKANSSSNKSPIVTEYSYSIKEIQSTIRYTAGKTNSEENMRNLIQSDDTKTRLRQISHKSVLNKNYNVQKQETTFKTLSMSKDRFDNKSSDAMKFNVPQPTPKQLSKKENESKTSKKNKNNSLKNILARLEVDHTTYDSQKYNSFVDNKTKLSKKRNNLNKNPPDLETSILPMESSCLSPEQVEQGHYNLRKRKCKKEELDKDQSSKNKFDFYLQSGNSKSCSVANYNSTRKKRTVDWNDENTCNTDSSCEIIDIPKQKTNQKKNGKRLKTVELKNSYPKSKYSSRSLLKKEKTEFRRKVTTFQEPLNSSDDSNVDTEGSIYELRDLNTSVTNKIHTKVNPIVPWNEDDTFDKSNTDSSFENFNSPKESGIQMNENQNRNQSKKMKVKESNSDVSKYPNSNKNNKTEFEKSEALFHKSKFQTSLNKDTTHSDNKTRHLGKYDKSKNMFKKNNELLSKANSHCSNKLPQMIMKTTKNKNQHLHSGKERIFHNDFLQETKLSSNSQIRSYPSKQNLEKSTKEDSYKKYLETIFKNTVQKTSTHRNDLSMTMELKRSQNALMENSEENNGFSLSSSDSEDCEMLTPKIGLGLLDDILCRDNENGEE